MDGFDNHKGIVVLAATNRPETLDPALLRPGRFDRRIPVELPDLAGREAILKIHANDVKMEHNIDLSVIARSTPGASGADLANIINEAALRAVRYGRNRVSQEDLEESVDVVIAGEKKKSTVLSEHEKEVVAYHETGHAIVAAMQTGSAPVQKITIVPRTSGALGFTMQVEEDQHFLTTRKEAKDKIAVLCGGRAAEELIFGEMTTGASNDIEKATQIARAMVTQYGMSDKFGMVALGQQRSRYLGGGAELTCSEGTAQEVDAEVQALVEEGHTQAMETLKANRFKLHEIAHYLQKKETITGEEFMKMLKRDDGFAPQFSAQRPSRLSRPYVGKQPGPSDLPLGPGFLYELRLLAERPCVWAVTLGGAAFGRDLKFVYSVCAYMPDMNRGFPWLPISLPTIASTSGSRVATTSPRPHIEATAGTTTGVVITRTWVSSLALSSWPSSRCAAPAPSSSTARP